jgi:hypothetical protein
MVGEDDPCAVREVTLDHARDALASAE